MASSPALLHSTGSSFCSSFPVHFVRLPSGNLRARSDGLLVVKANSGAALVEKTEAEKVNRLKSRYLEKIVPLLKEEFKYTNIHQVVFDSRNYSPTCCVKICSYLHVFCFSICLILETEDVLGDNVGFFL